MIRSVAILAALLILAGCSKEPLHPELAAFINAEHNAHPRMSIADVYKLLYQAEYGPRHIVQNPSAAREYLSLEAKSRGPNPSQPLTEACSPDGKIVRINLAPFLAKNLSFEKLFRVLEESAAEINGSDAELRATWKKVGELIEAFAIPIPKESYQEFTRYLEENKYPEVHHSREYTTEYHPAYRVARKSIFEKHFPELRGGAAR